MARGDLVSREGIKGVAEFKRTLERLGAEVATKIGVRAARAGAVTLKDAIVAAAPVGPDHKRKRDYGHLRDNIRVSRGKARRATTITFTVGSGDAFWAYFLEFGTRHAPSHPFWRAAQDAAVPSALAVQLQTLRDGVERAAKNGGVDSAGADDDA